MIYEHLEIMITSDEDRLLIAERSLLIIYRILNDMESPKGEENSDRLLMINKIKNLMEDLIKSYNEAYFKGIKDMVIWNGTEQRYGKPYSCQVPDDVNLIRGFENVFLNNMH
jgi:hypothetical protein